MALAVYRPCFQAFLLPFGAPPPAPCIRHTDQPLTAGNWHSFLDRFEVARQRLAWVGEGWRCMGLILRISRHPTTPLVDGPDEFGGLHQQYAR
jgi:hypothetical protein